MLVYLEKRVFKLPTPQTSQSLNSDFCLNFCSYMELGLTSATQRSSCIRSTKTYASTLSNSGLPFTTIGLDKCCSRDGQLVTKSNYGKILITRCPIKTPNGPREPIICSVVGLYNMLMTSLPPVAIGLFDQNCSEKTRITYPGLYKTTQSGRYFNLSIFWMWILDAVVSFKVFSF